jgi:hypothetical protein
MDEQQRKAFEEAVERKKAEALERSRNPKGPVGPGDPITGDPQPSITGTATTQDATDPRAKNARNKKVTADKWNQ